MPGKPGCSGRPRKNPNPQGALSSQSNEQDNATKHTRGRPRKRPLEEDIGNNNDMLPSQTDTSSPLLSTSENSSSSTTNVSKPSPSRKSKKRNLRKKSAREVVKKELIGCPRDLIPTNRLPTIKVLLQRWRAYREMVGQRPSNAEIASAITNEILEIWARAKLPTIRKDHVKTAILNMYLNFESQPSLKRPNRKGNDQKENVECYQNQIEHCFDIGVPNMEEALKSCKSKNWRNYLEFYQNQLKVPQVDYIPGETIDFKQNQVEKRSEKRRAEEEKREESERNRVDRCVHFCYLFLFIPCSVYNGYYLMLYAMSFSVSVKSHVLPIRRLILKKA